MQGSTHQAWDAASLAKGRPGIIDPNTDQEALMPAQHSPGRVPGFRPGWAELT